MTNNVHFDKYMMIKFIQLVNYCIFRGPIWIYHKFNIHIKMIIMKVYLSYEQNEKVSCDFHLMIASIYFLAYVPFVSLPSQSKKMYLVSCI